MSFYLLCQELLSLSHPKKNPHASEEGGGCAAAATKEGGGDSASNMELHFRPCDEKDAGQTFHAKPRFGGFEIKVGETGYCLDSGGAWVQNKD